MILTLRESIGVLTLENVDEIQKVLNVGGFVPVTSDRAKVWKNIIDTSPYYPPVQEWLVIQGVEPGGISFRSVVKELPATRQPSWNLDCKVHMSFKDPDKAFLFKLTFG